MVNDPIAGIHALLQSEDMIVSAGEDKLRTLCSEARDTWASAAFSATKQEQLIRYFSYQLKQLCHLPHGHSELLLLADHLLKYFGKYLESDILLSKPYIIHAVKPSSADVVVIKTSIDRNKVSGLIRTIIIGYLDGQPAICTIGQLAYFKNFVRSLKQLTQPSTEAVVEKLLELEFNHLAMLEYFEGELGRKLHGKTPEQKMVLLQKEKAMLALYTRNSVEPFDSKWPKLSVMRYDLLTDELKSLRPVTSLAEGGQKFRLELSVAHVACFLRLFVHENITGIVQLSKLFQFVTRQFKTKRTETISPGSLSKEYYSISQSTAAEVRHLLTNMINRINRDYFPLFLLTLLVFRQ